jgi:hypothetical protein
MWWCVLRILAKTSLLLGRKKKRREKCSTTRGSLKE